MSETSASPTVAPAASSRRVELIAVPALPDFAAGDDLAGSIVRHANAAGIGVAAGDVVVVAQKIVSKCEGAYVDLASITPGEKAKVVGRITGKDPRLAQAILDDTAEILRARENALIVAHRNGHVMANAGIDASNVGLGYERVLRLPADADASARRLSEALQSITGVRVAVIINDSWGRAWRNGTVGHAVGASGLPALWDRRGEPDMNGRALRVTEIGLADEIAAAASMVMGAGAERQPVVIVRGLSLPEGDGSAHDLVREKSRDLFR